MSGAPSLVTATTGRWRRSRGGHSAGSPRSTPSPAFTSRWSSRLTKALTSLAAGARAYTKSRLTTRARGARARVAMPVLRFERPAAREDNARRVSRDESWFDRAVPAVVRGVSGEGGVPLRVGRLMQHTEFLHPEAGRELRLTRRTVMLPTSLPTASWRGNGSQALFRNGLRVVIQQKIGLVELGWTSHHTLRPAVRSPCSK